MKNKGTIDQINQFVEAIERETPTRRDIVQFNLQDIVINDKFIVDEMDLTDRAADAVLSVLNAKPAFKEYQSLMEVTDWNLVSSRLKAAKGDVNLYGSLLHNPDGTHTIDAIFFKNPKKNKADDLTNSKALVETVTRILSTSSVDWSLSKIGFDNETSKYTISLLNDSNPIEVFENDLWKQGQTLIFNSTSFINEPFFDRLICGNGMRKPSYGFRSNISKASFNNEKLEKAISNALSEDNDNVAHLIKGFAEHMKGTTISLREFYNHRNFLIKRGYEELADKYFIEAPFYKAWGDNVCKKSKTWKASADTGINAYDFINLNTWLASHIEESKMSEAHAYELKNAITGIFTAKELDMELIASQQKVEYPHFVEME
ncbi:MAG: hypothetical protein WC979_01715 [Candidatus Pacearchaeota archaeon]|jgi:hypothetical protein|nr:hypothetical protein [Clostridia bacterium]